MTMETYTEPRENLQNNIDAQQQREGRVARAIEQRTAKIPSDVFLWGAAAAVVGSLVFQVIGSRNKVRNLVSPMRKLQPMRAPASTFIGMWVPTLLLLGLYNKLVKVAGSDRVS
jgi:hypothetical protein